MDTSRTPCRSRPLSRDPALDPRSTSSPRNTTRRTD